MKQQKVELRPVVQWFAEQMELKLRENDDKGGWHDDSKHGMLVRVVEELAELVDEMYPEAKARVDFGYAVRDLLRAGSTIDRWGPFLRCRGSSRTLGEAVDVANMVMMVADFFRKGGPSQDQGKTL